MFWEGIWSYDVPFFSFSFILFWIIFEEVGIFTKFIPRVLRNARAL